MHLLIKYLGAMFFASLVQTCVLQQYFLNMQTTGINVSTGMILAKQKILMLMHYSTY
jgi:hypothetical protein